MLAEIIQYAQASPVAALYRLVIIWNWQYFINSTLSDSAKVLPSLLGIYFYLGKRMLMNRKICVLTGTCSGIGQQMAYELLKRGAYVIMIDKFRPEETLQKMNDIRPGHFELHLADLSNQQELKIVASAISNAHPVIHLLINNAGRHIIRREVSTDGYEMNFALNCLGTAALCLHFLPNLKKAPSARIVNIASEAHRVPGRFNFEDLNTEKESMIYAYGKSKFGIILFSKALAAQLKETNITVNAVCPGLVATSIFANFLPRPVLVVTDLLSKTGLMSTPTRGALIPISLACDQEYESVSGEFFGSHSLMKHISVSNKTNNPETQAQFFSLCKELTSAAA